MDSAGREADRHQQEEEENDSKNSGTSGNNNMNRRTTVAAGIMTTCTTVTGTKMAMSGFEFGFPFPPYGIQVELMQCMRTAMQEGSIGIVESPTGTGKTLSIICSSLSWLLQQRQQTKDQAVSESQKLSQRLEDMSVDERSELDWVAMHATKQQLLLQKVKVKAMLDLISWKETRDAQFRERKNDKVNRMLTRVKGKTRNAGSAGSLDSQSACNALPAMLKRRQACQHPESRDQGIVSPESLDIQQLDACSSGDEDEEKEDWDRRGDQGDEDEKRVTPQIIYACRTHSQLAQFVNEVKKTAFSDQIRLVSLASRANLCVNPSVSATRSSALINDRCMDLMRKGERNKKHRCPFLSQNKVSTLADEILSDVQDIEQVHEAGQELSACAYYASRSAVREADLIVMPYNILIHEKTRASFGIDVRQAVVIIDEAHNLLDTIAAVHSAEVSQEQLTGCLNQLRQYVTRYSERLNPANLLHLKQLQSFIKSIVSLLHPNDQPDGTSCSSSSGGGCTGDDHHQEPKGKVNKRTREATEAAPVHQRQSAKQQQQNQEKQGTERVFAVLDFVVAAGIDNINLFNLVNYCEKSQLARKLFAFPCTVPSTGRGTESSLLSLTTTSEKVSCKQLTASHLKTRQEHEPKRQTAADEQEQIAATTKAKGDMDSPSSRVPATQASGTNAFLSRIKSNVNNKSRTSSEKDKVIKKKTVQGQKDKDKKGEGDESQDQAINDPKRVKRIVHSSSSLTNCMRTGPSPDSPVTANQESGEQSTTPTSPLYSILEFMKCLTNRCSDGRILVTRGSSCASVGKQVSSDRADPSLRYFLLNSSHHFREVVTSCRSLILAGGTMKPFEEYTGLLFGPMGVPAERIITFSCGHVIPKHNILPIALAAGPSSAPPSLSSSSSSSSSGSAAGRTGMALNYSFAQRSHPRLIEETGQILVRLSALTPGGIVVFFPSYDYLDLLYGRWESCHLLKQIRANGKKVFREPRKASEVSRVLNEYSRANSRNGPGLGSGTAATGASRSSSSTSSTGSSLKPGGILLSVVGGKVSEGINFSDDMCRCVVMIGMPYANVGSLQLQEKMAYFDKSLGAGKGRFYYENLCFKAINQSIGRSIRHKEDYSVILLLDQRYTDRRDQVKHSLPGWIADHLIDSRSFDSAVKSIDSFFASKKRTG